jgi:hypothetical protein
MYVMISFAFTPAAMRTRRGGVARLVEANRLEAGSLPGTLGSAPEVRRLERRLRCRAEDESAVAALASLVLDEDVSERADDWDGATPRAALRLDLDARRRADNAPIR